MDSDINGCCGKYLTDLSAHCDDSDVKPDSDDFLMELMSRNYKKSLIQSEQDSPDINLLLESDSISSKFCNISQDSFKDEDMMNGHTSLGEDLLENMKQTNKELKEKNIMLESQIAKYEIDLSQNMEILLKTKQDLDKFKEKYDVVESENAQLKEKVNLFEAQIYQLQGLKMKKVEENNTITDLQRDLSSKEKIIRKLKGDFENITLKLSEKKKNIKKVNSTNKRLWNLIAEFESALSKAGLLSSKQKRLLLKEQEEETVSSDTGNEGDSPEKKKTFPQNSPISENQPIDKSKQVPGSIDTFLKPLPNPEKSTRNESSDDHNERVQMQDIVPSLSLPCSSVKSFGSNYFMKTYKSVIEDPHVSDDCLDISNSELKDLRQQFSMRSETFAPISPLPPTPPPKNMKSKLPPGNESEQIMKSAYKRLNFCHQQSESFDIQSEQQSPSIKEHLPANHDFQPSNGKYTISTKRNLDGSLKFDFNASLNTHLSLDVNTFQVSCTVMPVKFTDFPDWKNPQTLQHSTPVMQNSLQLSDSHLALRKDKNFAAANHEHEQMPDISTSHSFFSNSVNEAMSKRGTKNNEACKQSKKFKRDCINEVITPNSQNTVTSSESDKKMIDSSNKENPSSSPFEKKIGTQCLNDKTSVGIISSNCNNKEDLQSAFTVLPVSAHKKRKQSLLNPLTIPLPLSSGNNDLNAVKKLNTPNTIDPDTEFNKNEQIPQNSDNVFNSSPKINKSRKKRKGLKRKANINKSCLEESVKSEQTFSKINKKKKAKKTKVHSSKSRKLSKSPEKVLKNESENIIEKMHTDPEIVENMKFINTINENVSENFSPHIMPNNPPHFVKNEQTASYNIDDKRKRTKKSEAHCFKSRNLPESSEKIVKNGTETITEKIQNASEMALSQKYLENLSEENLSEILSSHNTTSNQPEPSVFANEKSPLNSKSESLINENVELTSLTKEQNGNLSELTTNNYEPETLSPSFQSSEIQLQINTKLYDSVQSDFLPPTETTEILETGDICNEVDLTGISLKPFNSSSFTPRGLFRENSCSPEKLPKIQTNSSPSDLLITHNINEECIENCLTEEVVQSSVLHEDNGESQIPVVNGFKTDNNLSKTETDDYDSDHSLIIADNVENDEQAENVDNDEEKSSLAEQPLKKSPNTSAHKKRKKKGQARRLTVVKTKKRNVDYKTNNSEQISIADAFKILDEMKFTDLHFKQNQHTVANAFINPKNASSTKDVVYNVLKYLSTSRANPLLNYYLSQDSNVLLPIAEKCITNVLLSLSHKFTHRLYGLLDSIVETAFELVLAKEKFTIYGLGSICRVLTEICKHTKNSDKPLLLCSELLKIQHKYGPYLIASVASVWPELFSVSGLSDEELVFHSSLSYGVHKKPHLLTEQHWKNCCKILSIHLNAPRLSPDKDTVNYLIESIQTKCINGTLKNEYLLTTPLITLAIVEGWEWAKENLIDDHIIPLLVKFSEHEMNEQAFHIFCHLYVDICNFCPDEEDIHEVLINFFENQPETEGDNFIKDTVAMAQMKLILHKKQLVPPHLAEWIGKNQDNKEKADYAETLFRRRLMVDENELLISEIL